jgi:hypothetical protein
MVWPLPVWPIPAICHTGVDAHHGDANHGHTVARSHRLYGRRDAGYHGTQDTSPRAHQSACALLPYINSFGVPKPAVVGSVVPTFTPSPTGRRLVTCLPSSTATLSDTQPLPSNRPPAYPVGDTGQPSRCASNGLSGRSGHNTGSTRVVASS